MVIEISLSAFPKCLRNSPKTPILATNRPQSAQFAELPASDGEQTGRFERLCFRALAEGALSESKASELPEMSGYDLNRQMEDPSFPNVGVSVEMIAPESRSALACRTGSRPRTYSIGANWRVESMAPGWASVFSSSDSRWRNWMARGERSAWLPTEEAGALVCRLLRSRSCGGQALDAAHRRSGDA